VNAAKTHNRMPHVEAGMKVGLYGGSFNPPHQGHKHLAMTALRRFQLDQIWWMVSPGNPLKEKATFRPVEERISQSRTLVHHPHVKITGFETGLHATSTIESVAFIQKHCPKVRFVWLMGADNLCNFHLWQQWRRLAGMVGLGIIDRPGSSLAALASPAAHALSHFRLAEAHAAYLAYQRPPAWCFLHTVRVDVSSSHLRLIESENCASQSTP